MNIKRLVIRKYRVLDRLDPQKVKIDRSSSNFLSLFRLNENTLKDVQSENQFFVTPGPRASFYN